MSLSYVNAAHDAVHIMLYVSPRASRTKLCGEHDGRLKIHISAPPVDGKANAEIIKFFAKMLGVSKREVTILSGESGRRKTLRITDTSHAAVCEALS